jgi:hypothetical protein
MACVNPLSDVSASSRINFTISQEFRDISFSSSVLKKLPNAVLSSCTICVISTGYLRLAFVVNGVTFSAQSDTRY